MKRHVPKAEDTPLDLGDENCGICGERFTEHQKEVGDIAEMYLPHRYEAERDGPAKIVHAECGISHGWEIA